MPANPPQSLSASSVLSTAKGQLRRFGESKTNMVDIARAMGVSHAALYRYYPSKSAIMDAIVEEAMRDEEHRAAEHLNGEAPAALRLFEMIYELHLRKRERFVGDREVHELYRRILVERPDIIADYARRMTALIAQLVAQGQDRGEWDVDDVDTAAGVVRDAVTAYVNPVSVVQLVTANFPVEAALRATIATLARAFEAGMRYRS